MRRFKRLVVVAGVVGVFAAAGAPPASAAPILLVDQANGTANVLVTVGERFGQSFTPALGSLDAWEFTIASDDSEPTNRYRVDIYGQRTTGPFSGPLLGQSGVVLLPDSFAEQVVHFDFAAAVTLAPGVLHDAELVVLEGDVPLFRVQSAGGSYASGTFIQAGGDSSARDALFTEGLHVIPEPATALLLATGLAGLAAARRRRSRQ